MPSALITGITGQDGQYLAEFLHSMNYKVYGLVKGQANPKAASIQRDLPFVEIVSGDLQDLTSLIAALALGHFRRGCGINYIRRQWRERPAGIPV